jgi:hypothetical protein
MAVAGAAGSTTATLSAELVEQVAGYGELMSSTVRVKVHFWIVILGGSCITQTAIVAGS